MGLICALTGLLALCDSVVCEFCGCTPMAPAGAPQLPGVLLGEAAPSFPSPAVAPHATTTS